MRDVYRASLVSVPGFSSVCLGVGFIIRDCVVR